jgi:16S rRNA (cytosine1402-N4)-methyltransferase
LADIPHDPIYHKPVLAEAAVGLLVTDPNGIYIDATVGGGGHSRLIWERLSGHGVLIGADRDSEAIWESRAALPPPVILIQSRFSELESKTASLRGAGANGILMDLGVSSHQIDTAARGFSHRYEGPLDLRMDPTQGESAAQLLRRSTEAELARIIFAYGEDTQARRIAKAIVQDRERQQIETTADLARIIDKCVPATRMKSLARVFQALRIAVNDELAELEAGLANGWEMLKPDGRLVVISYHSLEDRLVKGFMRSKAEPPQTTQWPFPSNVKPSGRLLVKKPLTPDEQEVAENPRARSAKLRAIIKLYN